MEFIVIIVSLQMTSTTMKLVRLTAQCLCSRWGISRMNRDIKSSHPLFGIRLSENTHWWRWCWTIMLPASSILFFCTLYPSTKLWRSTTPSAKITSTSWPESTGIEPFSVYKSIESPVIVLVNIISQYSFVTQGPPARFISTHLEIETTIIPSTI